jgi:hypothetical protein
LPSTANGQGAPNGQGIYGQVGPATGALFSANAGANSQGASNGQNGTTAGAVLNPSSAAATGQTGANPGTTFNLNTVGTVGRAGANPGATSNYNATNGAAFGAAGAASANANVNAASNASVGANSTVPNSVQWSGGRWWYKTPQETWMYYNNGAWVNYGAAQ